jgi:hypothetical protein
VLVLACVVLRTVLTLTRLAGSWTMLGHVLCIVAALPQQFPMRAKFMSIDTGLIHSRLVDHTHGLIIDILLCRNQCPQKGSCRKGLVHIQHALRRAHVKSDAHFTGLSTIVQHVLRIGPALATILPFLALGVFILAVNNGSRAGIQAVEIGNVADGPDGKAFTDIVRNAVFVLDCRKRCPPCRQGSEDQQVQCGETSRRHCSCGGCCSCCFCCCLVLLNGFQSTFSVFCTLDFSVQSGW